MVALPHLSLLRARLVACLGALWVVFGSSFAHAATWVPMCGEHAQTVIAPPISRAASDSMVRESPCDRDGLELQRGAPERAPERIATPEDTPRLLPIYFRLYPVPRARLSLATSNVRGAPGYPAGIERPPR